MIFAFIDESGYPRPEEPYEWSTLVAVCVRHTDVRTLTQQLYRTEMAVFGPDMSGHRRLKGNNLVDPRSLSPHYTNRREYVDRVIGLLGSHGVGVLAVIMEKPDYQPYVEPGFLPKQYRYLLDRLNYLGEDRHDDVLVIYDKVDEKKDAEIANGFKGFLFKSGLGQTYTRVIEMPLFVSSQNTPFIRLPDLVGNILREFHNLNLHRRSPGNEFEEWLRALESSIATKCPDFRRGTQTYYGMYRMTKEKFPRYAPQANRRLATRRK